VKSADIKGLLEALKMNYQFLKESKIFITTFNAEEISISVGIYTNDAEDILRVFVPRLLILPKRKQKQYLERILEINYLIEYGAFGVSSDKTGKMHLSYSFALNLKRKDPVVTPEELKVYLDYIAFKCLSTVRELILLREDSLIDGK